MPPANIVDLEQLDHNHIIADRAAIRSVNPQRHEFEMLDAVIHVDQSHHIFVGYKDVRADEFWARGHFPHEPMFPGVLMCEAAAQLCSYYIVTQKINDPGSIVGFGGLENVRFRNVVRPGDRLILVSKAQRLHRRQSVFNVQGFVGTAMAFHADIIGIPLKLEAS